MTEQQKAPELDDASIKGHIKETSPADNNASHECSPHEWLQQMPLGAYDDADRQYGEHAAATDLGGLEQELAVQNEQLCAAEVEPASEVKYTFDPPPPVLRLGKFDAKMKRQAAPPVVLPEFIEPLPEVEPPKPRTYDELLRAAETLESDADAATIEGLAREADALSKVECGRILRVIKRRTGTNLGDLRGIISDSGRERPDDLTLARQVLVVVCPENIFATGPFVYFWQASGVWRPMQDRAVKQTVQNALEGSTAITANTVNQVTDVLKTAVYMDRVELNRGDPSTVNALNGEIVITPGAGCWELQPHNRDAYRTTQIPIKFDPDATAPRFVQFLDEIFRDDPDKLEKIECLLQLIGYSLMSHCRYERFVILIGTGANGKSVFLAVLEGLLGVENVAGVQPAQFDNRFQRAHLNLKLANIVTEMREGEVIPDAVLKSIVSGESTTAEHKLQHPFDFRPYATCWFGTNFMPHTRDFSDALFRRAVIITFNRKFDSAKGEADPLLKDKLLNELPGILNMALEAYARWVLSGKFTEPQSSLSGKSAWRLEADQVLQFVDERCTRDPKERVRSQQLYDFYRRWTDEVGISQRLTQKSFVSRLERHGFGRGRDMTGKYITGITFHSG